MVVGLCVAGCVPLPIPHMEQASPSVVGALRDEDGAPMTGVRVAAAEGPERSQCAWSHGEQTDASGRFRLPGVRVRRNIVWLTLFERVGMRQYWLCARADSVASDAARSLFAQIDGTFRGDTVACLAWRWRDSPYLTCDAEERQRTRTGGAWADSNARGVYRLIIDSLDPKKYWHTRAFVQWVELTRDGKPGTVRTTIELPTEGDVDQYEPPSFSRPTGRWTVVVKSDTPTKWGNDRYLVFELGAPGVVTRMPDQ